GADNAREAADLLGSHGIPLVRHRRTAFLALGKILLGFADFRALQMADFERDLFAKSGCEREGCDEGSVPVALDHLRSDRGGLDSQAGTDALLSFRTDVAKRADCAEDFADAEVLGGRADTGEVAAGLLVPNGELQA